MVPTRALVAPARLYPVVTVAGAGSLAVEICASRLLAPYFGSSTVVWANIIGLILLYLSVGYWIGGRLADRRAGRGVLGTILLLAAACIAVLPFIARPLLDATVHGLKALSIGAAIGSFVATLAMFSVPVILLGMVSPFAIRLALRDVSEAGTISGRLYSLSTVGSIAGTFVPAIGTIPFIGTQRTMLSASLLLTLGAALLVGVRAVPVAVAVGALLAVPPGTVKSSTGLLFERESQYQYVRVITEEDGHRELQTNEGVSSQSVWRPNTVLTGGEWDMFLVAPPMLDHPVRRVLVIGNAGGTIARSYAALYPGVHIDGVELDPVVTEAGREFMGLDSIPGLTTITADGRDFLRGSDARYDVIALDAYRVDYIPFYMATQEFFQLCREHLGPGGALAINVARVPRDQRLGDAVAGTVATVFPSTWRWPALNFNELVIGIDRPVDRDTLIERLGSLPTRLASLDPLLRAQLVHVQASSDPMTDDRAPVEWLSDRMYLEQIRAGAQLEEHYLPTHP